MFFDGIGSTYKRSTKLPNENLKTSLNRVINFIKDNFNEANDIHFLLTQTTIKKLLTESLWVNPENHKTITEENKELLSGSIDYENLDLKICDIPVQVNNEDLICFSVNKQSLAIKLWTVLIILTGDKKYLERAKNFLRGK